MVVHNKQFILSKQPHLINEDWCTIQMSNGYILSYQENLHVVSNNDNSILLIGDAWSVEPEMKSPQSFIQQLPSFSESSLAQIDEEESAWNGRYLLIIGDYISLDAVGAYGVFYSNNSLSSSLPLICRIENREVIYPDTKWGDFPDFVPGPYTQIDGVKRVMPSQRFNYVTHEFFYHKFLVPLQNNIEENVLLEKLSQMFETSLKNMYEHFGKKPIWLALTGGKDSRTSLAFLFKCKLPFSLFTFTFSDSSKLDSRFAKCCAFVLGKKHYTIAKDDTKFSNKEYENYKAHTMLMNVDGDSVLIPHGMYNELYSLAAKDYLMLRNNAWESIMDYYSAYNKTTDELILKLRAYGKNDKSIDEWLQWVKNDSLNSDISLWDRIFWEQREGCWLSSIEQSLEIMENMTCVQMCNSRKILAYLHAFPLNERRAKKHNEKLIKIANYRLCRVPFGDELKHNESIYHAYIRKKFPTMWRKLKNIKAKFI